MYNPGDSDITFGRKLKSLRHHFGLTQAKLAEMLHVTPITISRYENNLRQPGMRTLLNIANVLDIDDDYLVQSATSEYEDWLEYKANYMEEYSKFLEFTKHELENIGRFSTSIDNYLKELNAEGKKEAVKRVEELTYIPKYTEPDDENK